MLEDIDRSLRIGKFLPAKTNPRPVIVKFARNNVRQRVFVNKRKLRRKRVSICESLTKLCLVKLNETRDQHAFDNVWTQEKSKNFT